MEFKGENKALCYEKIIWEKSIRWIYWKYLRVLIPSCIRTLYLSGPQKSPSNCYCFCPRNWITELLNRNDDIPAPFFPNYLKKFSSQSVLLKVFTTSSKFVGKENDWWGQNFQLNLAAMSHLWNVGQRSKINFPGFNFFLQWEMSVGAWKDLTWNFRPKTQKMFR